jgi:2-polyprenyl-3-methyl-5-hydroxy-6-metoxy-1,4-benzoquinol methylase
MSASSITDTSLLQESEHYDQLYFDRWYRDPSTSVSSSAATMRKASLALSIAEYYLERPVATVFDVACGEGNWLHPLQSLRPGIHFTGVDSSRFAVSRFGVSRNIRFGSFATLEESSIGLETEYDLIVCSDAIAYVSSIEVHFCV